jgi:hypothetical protein
MRERLRKGSGIAYWYCAEQITIGLASEIWFLEAVAEDGEMKRIHCTAFMGKPIQFLS